MTRSVHPLFIGETGKFLTVTFLNSDRSEFTILETDTVNMVYTISGTRFTREMTRVSDGRAATYQWLSTDFDDMTAGDWPLQFEVVRDGLKHYFPCPKEGAEDSEVYDILRVREAL